MRYCVKCETFDMGDAKDKALKPLEEAFEAREAVQVYWPARRSSIGKMRDNLRRKALYECCDVLQATCNLLAMLGTSQAELDEMMQTVQRHNEARGRYA